MQTMKDVLSSKLCLTAAISATLLFSASQALANCPRGALDVMYCDRDGDMIADLPENQSEWVNPSTLIFYYVLGVLLSIPIAVMAAKNVAPLPIYILGRGIIIVSRSFHPVIVAILFVAAVGFGPLVLAR